MADFATLADALAGCATRVTPIACEMLFQAAKSPKGDAPSNTLTAAQSIVRAPWYLPGKIFASAHFSIRFRWARTCAGSVHALSQHRAERVGATAEIRRWWIPCQQREGDLRQRGRSSVGDDFTIGWQASDALWQGHATKFAPNGHPLSPITTGFAGGRMKVGTFGAAIDANDNAWLTSYGSKSITVFDEPGEPLTPPRACLRRTSSA